MKLQKLIEDLDYINISGDLEKQISGIEHNSKNIKENFLFIAIKGFKLDGHDFIFDALSRGSKVIVVENNNFYNKRDDITIITVKNSRIALAVLSNAFYNYPSTRLNIVGITGTNGKTSTSYFLESIFKNNQWKTGVIGTLGVKINEQNYNIDKTTPEANNLQLFLHNMLEKDINHCIMEVSSHSLSLNRVHKIQFDIGIFTNLSEEHLDFHKSLDEYMNSKIKLFYMTDKINIINSDDEFGKKMISKLKDLKTRIITYGINSGDIQAKNIIQMTKNISFDLVTSLGNINIKLNTPGIFNIYNALAAISCSIALGIDLKTIKQGLEKLENVKGRFQVIKSDEDFDVIIDFAHSPDGFKNVLKTVNEFAKARIITVFGCGGDRDKSKRPKMGEIAAKYSDICILTSDNSRSEDTQVIIEQIIQGIEESSYEYFKIPDRKKAIKKAIEIARPYDIVMILGKGHETYQIINQKKIEFDEYKIVKDILDSYRQK
ncbi:UDP-N-acetylmuramoyl-L-alanyl-D-glutamate--2,6-diaminopimelate ligase [Senegalia massiliensis]|uniref:UDP-N-acetylmuramyl-tripeptide synthetase n=1 Tax=Senegalia massiliensis TaxID=1720316 RepID=A0A845QX91_9CLOT|nr:UDP-N-acetylmuramoyl-L-alanyl-D-glutamate--2,6-diaminopimelate ligase [Senegalia massiliensis]NBI06760.1 UDP-N-acetylmuramoyl-L-alanyl-D-glutamate--2,6-diaminopimelate ligase [Senegalia massiliensis]